MQTSEPHQTIPHIDGCLGGEELQTPKPTQSTPNMKWIFEIGWLGLRVPHEMRALELNTDPVL